ncbi:MAG TPA: TRAP transporter small permease subunit [Beijerinckiaceae bacterium]|jgi:TRAP-type mannitol/chloroaromatic compound transport system permease small subunit
MTGLLGFSRAVDRLTAAAGAVADWLVLAAVLISASNAAIRYLVSYSSNAWLEIQWYMFGAIVLLGASHTLRKNEHVRVDLVYSAVSDRARLWIDIVGFVVFLLPVTIYLTYLAVPFFLQSFRQQEFSSNAGGLILWPIKLVIPVGFALLTLQGLSELIKRVAALHGDLTLDTSYEKPLQ